MNEHDRKAFCLEHPTDHEGKLIKSLHRIGLETGSDKFTVHCYSRVYDPLFSEFRHDKIKILEIGVQFGLSVNAWKEYFAKATIVGMDMVSNGLSTDERFTLVIGNQRNPKDLQRLIDLGPYKVIIDDGSHQGEDIAASFLFLQDALVPGGFYIAEDLHAPGCQLAEPWATFTGVIRNGLNTDFPDQCGDGSQSDCPWESITFHRSLCILKKK